MTIQAIQKRKSTRNYLDTPIKKEHLTELQAFITELNDTPGIFGNTINIQYLDGIDADVKLGTYGVIKGARNFLTASCKKDAPYNLEDLGYKFEKAILKATELGLGTVWLGGTFKRSNFAKAINMPDDEILPIVSPIGYEGGAKTLIGTVFGLKKGSRKPASELFWSAEFGTQLSEDDPYTQVLEAVRQGPSAVNAQPWRIIKDADGYHFYNAGKTDMSRIDLGIAMSHFEIASAELGLNGEFKVLNKEDVEKLKYLVSWV